MRIRFHKKHSSKIGSSGLGLSTVEDHGGSISIESKQNIVTIFDMIFLHYGIRLVSV